MQDIVLCGIVDGREQAARGAGATRLKQNPALSFRRRVGRRDAARLLNLLNRCCSISHRSRLLPLGLVLALMIRRTLPCRDLVQCAPFRFHPDAGSSARARLAIRARRHVVRGSRGSRP